MSFNKLEEKNFILCWWKIIPLPQIFVDILLKIKKTGFPVKVLRSTCTTYKRKKSLIVSDQKKWGRIG